MSMLESRTYEEVNIGDTASVSHTVSERDLVLFATVSGDVNPVHLDQQFAETTPFKGRIAHGMLSGALISAATEVVSRSLPSVPLAVSFYGSVTALTVSLLLYVRARIFREEVRLIRKDINSGTFL